MIEINKEYLTPKWALPRLALIFFLLIGWISIACTGQTSFFRDEYNATKIAYLVIAIIAFFVSIIIFAINLIKKSSPTLNLIVSF